jgi:predicted YcjX-like family ATPase
MIRFTLASALSHVLDHAREEARTFTRRVVDGHLRLAVTGLRRSGKTVFTTAMVHHLLDGRGLPFFRPVHEGRYLGARTLDPPGPPFPLDRMLSVLAADPPRWPEPTRALSTLRLELRATTTGYAAWLQPIRRLILDIVDYPGEWLLDLALLGLDYDAFSALALELARSPARAPLAAPFLALLAEMRPEAADPLLADRLASAFREHLRRAQEADFALLLPGRMVEREESADFAPFAPLPPDLASGPLGAIMRARYARYRETVVKPFYERWFARFDRQIVLVDLLSVLNRSPAHFEDTRRALALVLENFRYGRTGLLARLFAPRIDQVLFAMSKADHVAPNQHANAKALLALLVRDGARHGRLAGVPQEVMVLAALRCTEVVRVEHQGQLLSCVRGWLVDEDRETVLFPGEIPHELPEAEHWTERRFRFRRFAPKRLGKAGPESHIRLDRALDWLIGDHL